MKIQLLSDVHLEHREACQIFIVDLEASCWDDREYGLSEMEIIEIGAVLATPDGRILDEFCTFVRPTLEPILSQFCERLTSIRQRDIEQAPTYMEAMSCLDDWVSGRPGIWGSWGNYDFRQFMEEESRLESGGAFLRMQHVNLKKAWRRTTGARRTSLLSALEFHNMNFHGVHHRGIDDARNISRLLQHIDRHKLLSGVGEMQRGAERERAK